MTKCMGTDKPLISILMAVYEPRMDWLEEQLISLNNQTYPNLQLYVRDDCSPTVPYEAICTTVKRCITAFPYVIERNAENMGSNVTFEQLTREAEGEYFSYCDQDDVWLPHKLELLAERLVDSKVSLVCSDMYIIDGDGKIVANSITKVRRHHKFQEGSDLTNSLLVSNFVTGCTMIVSACAAKKAMPFCPYMVHDHYLALCCSGAGNIVTVRKPLIQYRIHGYNQTSDMVGVADKDSYCYHRIDLLIFRMRWLLQSTEWPRSSRTVLNNVLAWAVARKGYFQGEHGQIHTMYKYRQFGKLTTAFELVFAHLPNKIFMYIIQLKRKNLI